MSTVTGGLRARLLHDSFTATIENGLAGLGWLDSGRSHQPLQFLHGPHTWSVPVEFNTIVVTSQSAQSDEIEMGSNLIANSTEIYAELYAETDSLGMHLANDVRDLLRGRLPGGADREIIPILDYRLATPAAIGHANVLSIDLQRTTDQVPEVWARHVFTISVVLEDVYY